MPNIVYRAGGILINDRKTLIAKSNDKKFFIQPGGAIEQGESPKQALIRELFEEFRIIVNEANLEEFSTFIKKAGGQEDYDVHMVMFLVNSWKGELVPDNEIEAFRWISSELPSDIEIGSILKKEVIPMMKDRNLID